MNTTQAPRSEVLLDSDFDDPYFEEPTPAERQMAMLAHLSAFSGFVIPFGNIAGPLVMYLVKREESEFVADQAREALNFQITVMLAMIAAAVLIVVLIGIVLLPLLGIAALVLTVIGGVKANEGERYRYPFTLRLVS